MNFFRGVSLRKFLRSRRVDGLDAFLREVQGVIHVGANEGQERFVYDRLGLRVLWIEPIDDVYARLLDNIRRFPRQAAVKALVTDRDGVEYDFHISNNDGVSSSIMELKAHREIWPDVDYANSVSMRSVTLPTLMVGENLDIADYQALVMDTQGSELLVLQGAEPVVRQFEFIKVEVPDFESYTGCCQVQDMDGFMATHGFSKYRQRSFAGKEGVGRYFDIVYRRQQ
jgi:FkbM family methyltransferase